MTTWRGIMMAGMLAFLVTMVPWSEFAQSDDEKDGRRLRQRVSVLEQQVAALTTALSSLQSQLATAQSNITTIQTSNAQALNECVSVSHETLDGLIGPHVLFTGCNVHVRSGSGRTDDNVFNGGTLRGLGNLVVGYNEVCTQPVIIPGCGSRGGSHNLIISSEHSYSSFGGFVAGERNIVSGRSASVSGGANNVANGFVSSVSGGSTNAALGSFSSVSGGEENEALGGASSVSGGEF